MREVVVVVGVSEVVEEAMGAYAEVKELEGSITETVTGVLVVLAFDGEANDDGLGEGLGVVRFFGVFDPFGDGYLAVGDDGEDAVALDVDVVGVVEVVGVLDALDLLH